MPPTHSEPAITVDALYSQHHGWLCGWLSRKLGCPQQAADLAQDTFVRVLLRAEPVANSAPKALLSTIAKGLVIDYWRRSALERAYLEALAQVPEAYHPSAESHHENLQALEQIAVMLDGLKAQVRTAFLLYRLGGMTYTQVANQLGVSDRTVERYIAKAMFHCYRLRYQ